MLTLADIKFPITFESRGIGHYIFTDEKTCHNVWLHSDKPSLSTMDIWHFIDAHNQHYNSIRDYGYAMPGYTCLHYKPYKGQVLPVRSPEREDITKHLFGDAPLGGGKTSIQQIISEEIHNQVDSLKIAIANETEARVSSINEIRETMQQSIVTIRSKIGGIEHEGAIEDMPVAATLKGVRLDGGTWYELTATPKTIEIHDDVVILLIHYGSTKRQTVAGEISIKRGTMVKWKVKA